MSSIVRYLISRVIQYLVVLFVGITVVFFLTRLSPIDPVQGLLQRVEQFSGFMDPEAAANIHKTLTELYGLTGSIFDQYFRFWKHLLQFDLGPSLTSFPTPVIEIVWRSLPYTGGLMVISIVISWLVGNMLGAVGGYFRGPWSRLLELSAMVIYPIPYYIMALGLVILFVYVFPVFPLIGGSTIGMQPALTVSFIFSIIRHGFLPALSLTIINVSVEFLLMRSLVQGLVSSDYIIFAEAGGVAKRRIITRYLIRNAMLPRLTSLAIQLGLIFNGALVTEYVFSYPGLGMQLHNAILQGDFNLLMGIVIFSIVGIATATLILDLTYPLFDRRIRYQ